VSDFQTVPGFEDVWRSRAGPRRVRPRAVLAPHRADMSVGPRLARVAGRAPEVMVKVTGRTRDPGHLRAHMDYICRNGALEMEDRDGAVLDSRAAVRELADDWADLAHADPRRRANSPVTLSLVLSMPAATEPTLVRDAASAFARDMFADRFDYAFALHTDAEHPHVHLEVRALGDGGERLNPKKADLDAWRQAFAQALRDRGVEAEATPRRARGITRKAERMPIRRLRERHEAGAAGPARTVRAAYHEAARAALGQDHQRRPWETKLLERQGNVRGLYLAQARLLATSADPLDRALAARVETFVRAMPQPDTRRLALAREIRSANAKLAEERERPMKSRDR